MKVKGVILYRGGGDVENNKEDEAMRLLNIRKYTETYDGETYEQYDFDSYCDLINDAFEKLLLIDNRFFYGEENGQTFFFSDHEECVREINKLFPQFKIVEVEDNYSFSYDYIRDIL